MYAPLLDSEIYDQIRETARRFAADVVKPAAADLDRERSTVNFAELAKGARAASDLFPAVRGVRLARCWTGIEAQTRDRLPVIGASPSAPGLFHAFGFSGHGFQLVPVVGAILSDLVVEGGTRREIAAFAPQRLMQQRAAA